VSYDIFLIRFKDGRPAPIDAPAFWDLLAGAWQAAPDEHGCVRLVRGDGQADVYATPVGQPTDSVMVNHFGGEAIMDLIVELATESEAVIIGPGLPPLITRAG
jgi:hypothetical protein